MADCGSTLRREPPELRFVEQRDPMTLLAQPFDLHQLQSALTPGGLLHVRLAANDHRRPHRRHAMHHCASSPGCKHRVASAFRENAGEGQMHALERSKGTGLEAGRASSECLDHLFGALVTLSPFPNAPM